MRRMMMCVLATILLGALAAPLATADTVVDREVTAATGDDGTVTAGIEVINTGPDAVTLQPLVVPARAGCLPTASPASVAASQVTTVEVTLPDGCFDDAEPKAVAVDLDGVGPRALMPATVVQPPDEESSNWAPLWWGLFIGVLMGVAVGLWGYTEHQAAQAEVTAPPGPGGGPSRQQAYAAVQEIVDARISSLPVTAIEWTDLEPPSYDLTSPVGGLEAGWSFKDSWVSNITVASTALIALLTSGDALAAVLGEKPTTALAVMTVGGLVAAALIGIANTLAKLVGPSVSDVTVGGLILSTGLVVLAAGLQVTTVTLAAAGAAGWGAVAVAAVLLGLVVAGVLVVYAVRSLGQAIRKGFVDSIPVVPDTALSDWAATDDWDARVVKARIRATYADWLVPDVAVPAPDALPGTDYWAPVAPPPRRERPRSLL